MNQPKQLRTKLRMSIWHQIGPRVSGQVGYDVWRQLQIHLGDQVVDQVQLSINRKLQDTLK